MLESECMREAVKEPEAIIDVEVREISQKCG